jgi:hypothetical protein
VQKTKTHKELLCRQQQLQPQQKKKKKEKAYDKACL